MRTSVTWASLVAALSAAGTVVGGTQYVDRSIAEAERRAVARAEQEIQKRSESDARIYAKREDVREIQARLDQVLELQRAILRKLED